MPIIIHGGNVTINRLIIVGALPVASSGGGGGGALATGGTVVDITGYKVHIFNSSDTFATTASWPSGRTIEYVVVAGGGGCGNGESGGGAGGYLTAAGVTAVSSTNYAVTVGAGGPQASNGDNSSLIGGAISVTSIGGGAGGDVASNGQNGGSGGGGGTDEVGGIGAGGYGVYPGSPYLSQARQGYDGLAAEGKFGSYTGGHGGGAGGLGVAYTGGGPGLPTAILTTTSSSSLSITTGWQVAANGSATTINFTVASGLWYQANQAIYIYRTSDPTKYMWGKVNAYSGTTLTCRLVSYFTGSFSDWTIQYAMGGGGSGQSNDYAGRASLGGGGGTYSNTNDYSQLYDALPNTGGGGGYNGLGTGGSGVVIIKYAYP